MGLKCEVALRQGSALSDVEVEWRERAGVSVDNGDSSRHCCFAMGCRELGESRER